MSIYSAGAGYGGSGYGSSSRMESNDSSTQQKASYGTQNSNTGSSYGSSKQS